MTPPVAKDGAKDGASAGDNEDGRTAEVDAMRGDTADDDAMAVVRLEGQGLHTAARAAVRLERRDGPLALRTNDGQLHALEDVRVVDTTRSTTIATPDGLLRVATVEHLFAAFAGLGVHDGVTITFEGPEVPLLDGGARAFAEALRALRAPSRPPKLHVVKAGRIAVDASIYDFSVAPNHMQNACMSSLDVEVDFASPLLSRTARFDGDATDFLARIAPSRTFGFEHEVAMLLERGLASHVSPESVVVVGPDRVFSAGAPFTADEPARHKLLDLLGDLFLYGGPPRGHVSAFRPGHAATHRAMQRALDEGLVAVDA